MARKPNGQYAEGSNNATEGHPAYSVTPKSPRSIFKHILEPDQDREIMARNLRKLLKDPKGALLFLMAAADYLEGKPKQTTEHILPQQPVFEIVRPTIALTPPAEEPIA